MGVLDLFRKKEGAIEFDVVKAVKGSLDDFQDRLRKSSLIILIVGKRGSGKTALGFKFLESLTGRRKAYYIGKAKLPWWIKQVETIEGVRNDSLVLIDEGVLSYSARDAMSKSSKFLSKLMAIARHKNLTLIVITQNSAMLDLNILRLADTLLFKELSLLQSRFERKALADLFKKVDTSFSKIKDRDKKKYFYVIDDEFEGMLTSPLPKFWSEKISKSYSKIDNFDSK